MNTFQYIVLPVLVLVVLQDIRGLRQRRGNLTLRVIRVLAWCLAFALIAQPTWTSELSRQLGIGRGTDLMVYIFMLMAPVVWFRMQAQSHSLQRQIIRLARIEATRTAVAGDGLTEPESWQATNE